MTARTRTTAAIGGLVAVAMVLVTPLWIWKALAIWTAAGFLTAIPLCRMLAVAGRRDADVYPHSKRSDQHGR